MKKITAILGTNAEFSYNRILLHFIKDHFSQKTEINIIELSEFPMFRVTKDVTTPKCVMKLSEQIENSDGVIFSSPEYDHSITSSLKSILEWLSFQVHPLDGKPTMIVGTSYGVQGTVRAQSHLRDILDSPGINAHVMFGNEFMLGNAKEKLSELSSLTCADSLDFLEKCFDNFSIFIDMHNQKYKGEVLNAT